MNESILNNPCLSGYLIVPRMIFHEIIKNYPNHILCEEEAFLIMLFKSYHSTGKKRDYILERGESDLSIHKWALLFGWSIWRVRRFFNWLEKHQHITCRKDGKTRIIKINQYDLFCSNKTIDKRAGEEKPMKKSERMFIEFWETYHDLSLLKPSEKEAARRIWKRLKLHEKEMAIRNIYDYVMRTERVDHLKKAYRYLMDKEFN